MEENVENLASHPSIFLVMVASIKAPLDINNVG